VFWILASKTRRRKAALRHAHASARARPCIFLLWNDEHVKRKCDPDRRAGSAHRAKPRPRRGKKPQAIPLKKETQPSKRVRWDSFASCEGAHLPVDRYVLSNDAHDVRETNGKSEIVRCPKREERDRSTNPRRRTLVRRTCIVVDHETDANKEGDGEYKRTSERTTRWKRMRSHDTMTALWERIGNRRFPRKTKGMGARGFVLE